MDSVRYVELLDGGSMMMMGMMMMGMMMMMMMMMMMILSQERQAARTPRIALSVFGSSLSYNNVVMVSRQSGESFVSRERD